MRYSPVATNSQFGSEDWISLENVQVSFCLLICFESPSTISPEEFFTTEVISPMIDTAIYAVFVFEL